MPDRRLYAKAVDMYSVWDCMCVHLCHGFPTPVSPSGKEREIFDELERLFIEENRLGLSFPTHEV